MASYLERILRARVYDVAIESPLELAPKLSARLDCKVLFKREDLQPVFSFKLRGAFNKISKLTPAQLEAGVLCASAGNHAQGVALAAQHLGVKATVVMPLTTPTIKVDAVRALGAEIILFGESYDQAYQHARQLEDNNEATFIHPFDDPDVIAGQGTIAHEIFQQTNDQVNAIFVPIGGGGLAAGIAAYTKAVFPDTKIVGVQPKNSAAMKAAFDFGRPVALDEVGTFADGVAVRKVGRETYRICRECLDTLVLVDTDEICAAIRDIFEDTRTIVEPAGALAVAGLKKWSRRENKEQRDLGTVVTINCGANMNFDRLRHVAERASLGERQEAVLAVEIPETPGAFKEFCRVIGRRHVTEFNYRYGDPQRAHIFVGVELAEPSEKARLIRKLEAASYKVVDLSDNEVAKVHVRYMVGGRPPELKHEMLFRVLFPERRGALLEFLSAIGKKWSITLFHYRNHGSDYGRVLAGVQVPPRERKDFARHLEQLGYPCWDETGNPAYQLFLS